MLNAFLLCATLLSAASDLKPLRFDTHDHGPPPPNVPLVEPWRRIILDSQYGGLWVVTGDLDGDRVPEIVSCENVNRNDVHYTSTAVAQKLDGAVMWRWGDPGVGRKKWHHDVACQIHDWDGDGRAEVILATKGYLVELDGRTGREKRRIAIPPEATDCLVFADLAGRGRPQEVLVKTRYTQIWAYSREGKLLWTCRMPGGWRTAHQPRPFDLDGDGRQEIMAGYVLLNPDGSTRWAYRSRAVKQERGHLDCVRILKKARKLQEFRLALTCCGAKNLACIDGTGKVLWEVSGYHFESIQVGFLFPDLSQPQLLVDIDHRPFGKSPLCVFSSEGKLLGRIMGDYCRHHAFLDWTGDGYDEILIAYAHAVFNSNGRRIATLHTGKPGVSLLLGDMTGDGVSDVTIVTDDPPTVHIFRNERGKPRGGPAPPGCGLNFTLY